MPETMGGDFLLYWSMPMIEIFINRSAADSTGTHPLLYWCALRLDWGRQQCSVRACVRACSHCPAPHITPATTQPLQAGAHHADE